MNPLAWLNPGRWILYAAFAAALALGAWRLEAHIESIGYAKAQAEFTKAALAASEAARAKEQVLIATNAKVTNDYLAQKKLRAADAVVSAGKLRDLQAALSSPGGDAAPLGGADDPRDTIIDQCAGALLGMDEYAKGVALTAIGLQSYTRLVCMSK